MISLLFVSKQVSMAYLCKHSTQVFQNLSSPLTMDDTKMIPRAISPSPSKNFVSSFKANIGRQVESFTSGSDRSSGSKWLNRKSSFKAAARKSMRSISMTTMTASGSSKSPASHHRVSSVKSATAAILRKNNSSANMGVDAENKPQKSKRVRASNSFNADSLPIPIDVPTELLNYSPTSSSVCTTEDITSLSMPPLDAETGIATFDLSYEEESSIDDNDDELYGMDKDCENEDDDTGSVFSTQQPLGQNTCPHIQLNPDNEENTFDDEGLF